MFWHVAAVLQNVEIAIAAFAVIVAIAVITAIEITWQPVRIVVKQMIKVV
jgi:hypothetical protein